MKALIRNLRAVLPVERHAALDRWERKLEGTVANVDERHDALVADQQELGIGKEIADGA
jgi:hypothetical protein